MQEPTTRGSVAGEGKMQRQRTRANTSSKTKARRVRKRECQKKAGKARCIVASGAGSVWRRRFGDGRGRDSGGRKGRKGPVGTMIVLWRACVGQKKRSRERNKELGELTVRTMSATEYTGGACGRAMTFAKCAHGGIGVHVAREARTSYCDRVRGERKPIGAITRIANAGRERCNESGSKS